jgi:hypothetical protein
MDLGLYVWVTNLVPILVQQGRLPGEASQNPRLSGDAHYV